MRALAAGGFAGPEYTVLEEDLADYGIASMKAMLKSGWIFTRWDRNTSERGHGASEFLAGPGPASVRSLVRDQ